MILDNENKNLKVHEWITKYTESGDIDIVTGYFTIGALAYISSQINTKVSDFRMVLGDIVSTDYEEERPLDLLNENITIEAALQLNQVAQQAVSFLKQDKVLAKTLEPNFCHAKLYLFSPENNDDRNRYYVSGSSNLTEAGIGLKHTNNIELNIAESGKNNQYKELRKWFNNLWKSSKAHDKKTIIQANGKNEKVDFKQYLIDEIEKIFIKYTPREIYYKILFELFGKQLLDEQDDPEFNRQVGRLENSVIYDTLYEFQKKGVLSLIKMLQNYNGAILADAVGLGKTWSALAVMKFFQLQGREIILFCPKKLEHNWRRYRKNQDSKFEKDQLDFFVRFHTDLLDERLNKYDDRSDKYFVNDKPKLLVIDESHNLRNDKSKRYQFLLEEILKKNEDIKVLLLSATPINNSLNDIRNQFKLMVQGNKHGYDESLGVRNIDYTFRSAQKAFNDWRQGEQPKISEFISKLPATFFTLTDSLIVARTRKMVEGQQIGLSFPFKEKPENIFVTPSQFGNLETFEELFNNLPPKLSAYQPAAYVDDDNTDILRDEKQRDFFLVKMLYILMIKRLESSWFSFYSTVKKIQIHHQNALDKINAYIALKTDVDMEKDQIDIFEGDDLSDDIDDFTLGKKRKIRLSDIDKADNLDSFKQDLKKDLDALDHLVINLQKFEEKISQETNKLNNKKSKDDKLQLLIEQITNKQASKENSDNKKVVIFTAYRDTAEYIFEQLNNRGFDKLAVVSGTGSRVSDSDEETKSFEPILERFSPFTKIYNEKEWDFTPKKEGVDGYEEWVDWVATAHPSVHKQLKKPIDILIATDALSEGQNLQDADMVINYDIHWNPVRIIQRMGRIDRLGSPNKKIFGINFWPSKNINNYLDLQGRIEQRMAAMKLAGSEVDHNFSTSFEQMAKDESLDQKMTARMMKQMETTWDDIEVSEQGLGFDDLSLERYRQDLLEELERDKDKYIKMPKGIYTGFKSNPEQCSEDGLIALLGYPAKPANTKNYDYQLYDLIYINNKGNTVLLNQKEVLDVLTAHKDNNRYVPENVDKGDFDTIQALVLSLKQWLANQAVELQKQDDGSTKKTMGNEAKDILAKLKTGDKNTLKRVKQNIKVDDKFKLNNFDLITWFVVTRGELS